MTTINNQILSLLRDGLTPEQISEALGFDLDAVKLAIQTVTEHGEVTMEELIEKYRPEMVQVLYNIAVDESKNESARVKAASIIVEGKGKLPELPVDKLSEQFREMKRIVDAARAKVIDIPSERQLGEGCLAT